MLTFSTRSDQTSSPTARSYLGAEHYGRSNSGLPKHLTVAIVISFFITKHSQNNHKNSSKHPNPILNIRPKRDFFFLLLFTFFFLLLGVWRLRPPIYLWPWWFRSYIVTAILVYFAPLARSGDHDSLENYFGYLDAIDGFFDKSWLSISHMVVVGLSRSRGVSVSNHCRRAHR